MDSRIHQEDQERRGQEHLRQQHRLRLLPRLSLEVGEFTAADAEPYRDAKWLIKRQAVSVLPSVTLTWA